jgi:hypothetical protein
MRGSHVNSAGKNAKRVMGVESRIKGRRKKNEFQ